MIRNYLHTEKARASRTKVRLKKGVKNTKKRGERQNQQKIHLILGRTAKSARRLKGDGKRGAKKPASRLKKRLLRCQTKGGKILSRG